MSAKSENYSNAATRREGEPFRLRYRAWSPAFAQCFDCGALVWNETMHDQWHRRITDIESSATGGAS